MTAYALGRVVELLDDGVFGGFVGRITVGTGRVEGRGGRYGLEEEEEDEADDNENDKENNNDQNNDENNNDKENKKKRRSNKKPSLAAKIQAYEHASSSQQTFLHTDHATNLLVKIITILKFRCQKNRIWDS